MSDSEDEFQSADEGEQEALNKREADLESKIDSPASTEASSTKESIEKCLEVEAKSQDISAGDAAVVVEPDSSLNVTKPGDENPDDSVSESLPKDGDSSTNSSVSDKCKASSPIGKNSNNAPKGNKGGKSQRKNKNKKGNKLPNCAEVVVDEPPGTLGDGKTKHTDEKLDENTINQSDTSLPDQSECEKVEQATASEKVEDVSHVAPQENIDQSADSAHHIVESSVSTQSDTVKSSVSTASDVVQSDANIDSEQLKQSTEVVADVEPSTESESSPSLSEDSRSSSAAVSGESTTNTNTDKAAATTVQSVSEHKSVSSLFDKLSGSSESATMQRDTREESVLEKLALAGEKKQQSSWGSWGSWGSSLLNTASSSIHTFTDQVSEGMHTVVETFEASVGAPPVDQLDKDISKFVKEPDEAEEVIMKEPAAKEETSESADADTAADENSEAVGEKKAENTEWFSNWGVSDITNQLQSTTKGLVESGLDVLETIGKKTMEQIKETDPGYIKTKGLLRGNQANLSQTLREAKEENEKKAAEELNAQPLTNYSTLFDLHQGLACLEALELLSISCTNSLSNLEEISEEIQQHMDSLSEKFTQVYDSDDECDEEHDFSAGMEDFVSKLSLPLKHSKIVGVQCKAREWLTRCQERQDGGERIEGRDIHNEALNSFAELTSSTVELCHKSGALLLISPEQESTVDVDSVSDAFISILRLVNAEISIQSQKYNECLNTAADDSEDPDSINPMITNVFLEASNSTSYVRDAFKLLIPVLHKCLVIEAGGKAE